MKVYKYRGGPPDIVERDINSIIECYFWAPTPETLNDPAETLLVSGQADRLFRNAGEAELGSAYSDLVEMRSSCGVYSLSRTPLDELMWAYYGDGHAGFCIEYDLNRLVLEARNQWDVVSKVEYVSKPPEILAADIFGLDDHMPVLKKMLGTKSTRWAHEKELRIVTTRSGKNYHAAEAITGIHFGIRCPARIQHKVRRSLTGRGYIYGQIKMISESYRLKSAKLDYDSDLDGVQEAYSAEIEASAVPTSAHLGRYRDYLPKMKKALDIVRRDPSCKRILLVDVSTIASSNSVPQIYVQYETRVPTDLHPVLNRYFTLDEIS